MDHTTGRPTLVAAVTAETIALEVHWGREVYYLEVSDGAVRYRETTRWDRNASYIENLLDLDKLVGDLRRKYPSLGRRSVLAELEFDNHQVTVRRCTERTASRPVPWTVEERWPREAAWYEKWSETRFVWGAFDCEGVVACVDDWHGHPDEPATGGRDPHRSGHPAVILLTGRRPLWENGRLAALLRQGQPAVVLDTEDGFHLAPRHDRLPPPGVPRDRFGYMSVAWLPAQALVGRTVRVIADGQQGVLLVRRPDRPAHAPAIPGGTRDKTHDHGKTHDKEDALGNAPHPTGAGNAGDRARSAQDRRRTDLLPASRHRVTLTPVPKDFIPPFEQVTSVGVIAFTREGKVAVTLQSRGFDIPGGHVQRGDRSLEETARREALEEARVTLGKVEYLGALRSNYYSEPTYIVLMAAMVEQVLPFAPSPDHRLRLFLTPEQFASVYSAGDRERMQAAVRQARALFFP